MSNKFYSILLSNLFLMYNNTEYYDYLTLFAT